MTEEEFIKRYTPSEADELRNKIKLAKHSWIITDPYPEYSEIETFNSLVDFLNKENPFSWLPGLRLKKKPLPDIGPYKAWRDGYEFAWKLIESLITTGSQPVGEKIREER